MYTWRSTHNIHPMECIYDKVEGTYGRIYTRWIVYGRMWSAHTVGNTLTKIYSRQNVHPVRHTHRKTQT